MWGEIMNNEIKKEQFDRNNRKHNMKELSEIIYEEKTKNMSTQEKLEFEIELFNQMQQLTNNQDVIRMPGGYYVEMQCNETTPEDSKKHR